MTCPDETKKGESGVEATRGIGARSTFSLQKRYKMRVSAAQSLYFFVLVTLSR